MGERFERPPRQPDESLDLFQIRVVAGREDYDRRHARDPLPTAARAPRAEVSKPDFSDPGYGEIGCLFMAVGIAAGFIITVVLALLVGAPETDTGDAGGFLIWLGGVALCASTIGLLASAGLMALVERARPLWSAGEIVVFVGWGRLGPT